MDAYLLGKDGKALSCSENSDEADAEEKMALGTEALMPWVEKYRPKTINEIAYQDEVVAVLLKILQGADLFYGPPGTGKTSAILAASRQLFGNAFRERVLELNASDERGIQVIRDKVKQFGQIAASSKRPDGRLCPPLKIVILDEADAMTSAAQSALRRTMERESKTTRFCLICNYISRIIEPITSRCAKFRFKPLISGIQEARLKQIADLEHLKISADALKTLVDTSDGDLRKSIMLLQSVARFQAGEEILGPLIADIAGVIPRVLIEEFVKVCRERSYDQLEEFVRNIVYESYSSHQMLTQVFDSIIQLEDLSSSQKSAICEKLAACDKCLIDGADEYMQIMDMGCCIMAQCQKRVGLL